MFGIIALITMFALAVGGWGMVIYRKSLALAKVLRENIVILRKEKEQKEIVAKEMVNSLSGYVNKEDYNKTVRHYEQVKETLEEEQDKSKLSSAELDHARQRASELEEISRELEASALEASKELEILKKQELDLGKQTEKIKVELDDSLEELDRLLEQLSHSQAAVQTLNKTKTELIESQEKVIWYQERITEVNQQYAQLKKAYDALDIEYAQLYEKQNA
ncbi:MAG: hypothetical protein IT292_04610 [Deltaproteobacteria bacterium]|nr:hypothetical protein [Deltaproteobacteria bacterium]